MSEKDKATTMRSGLFGSGAGGDAVPLLGVDVKAEVLAGHACAVVRQKYKNNGTKPIEAVYTFPLPSKAILTGFSMTVEGRRLEGEVHEREEAFRRYDDAITAGHGSALLEQERPNVFTANVGNLLPGEHTIIEVQYVEPVLADEGAIRWSIPTLVAPRYIPGSPSGDRTAHGTADPTARVPDADRISPPIGDVSYGLALELIFDLGVELEIESASHDVTVHREVGDKARVTFATDSVALDRDVVITAFAKTASSASGTRATNKMAPIVGAVTHRVPGDTKPGAFALTIIPDLSGGNGLKKRAFRSDVVFVLDRSGSMGGASMPEARTALRLCLRQLREGDRFNILAFDTEVEPFAKNATKMEMVPFTQSTLQSADAWLETIDARGGTELLEPMREAAKLAPSGVIVLLTDGEVGNEDEVLEQFMSARTGGARVYSFGIGTNVSDALLHSLADKTGGAVEMIYPGERIDEKVVGQFARATAPRVTDVTIKTRGDIDLGEIAPAEHAPLVDGEPYCVFATYEKAGHGVVEIRGKLVTGDGSGNSDSDSFFLEVPVELAEHANHPVVAKLWARERIRDLERTGVLSGRRASSMKDRIVKLATDYGVSSKYTSFVVIEKRTGDRRATTQAETHVVPVSSPFGWDLTMNQNVGASASKAKVKARGVVPNPPAMSVGRAAPPPPAGAPITRGGIRPITMGAIAPPSAKAPAPAPAKKMDAPFMERERGEAFGSGSGSGSGSGLGSFDGSRRPMPPAADMDDGDDDMRTVARGGVMKDFASASASAPPPPPPMPPPASAIGGKGFAAGGTGGTGDPILDVLSRQVASGLWEERGKDTIDVTVSALYSLLRLGVSASHAIYGAQIKKAIEALLTYVQSTRVSPQVLEHALGLAWLLATGRRTRQSIEDTARASTDLRALTSALGAGNEVAVRAHVDKLAAPA